jgi:6-phosphogluconolactonase
MHAVDVKPGSGPRHAVFHPSKQILYVANEISCTVAVYAYTEDTLRPLWEHSTIATPLIDYTVADIHISPCGQFLSVTTRGENTIATYRILADGNLLRIEVVSCGGAWPRNFAFSPDGSYVLVACQNDNFIAVLPRDVATGQIGARVGTIPVNSVSFVLFL